MAWGIRKYPAISADTYLRETDFRAFSGDFGVSDPSPLFYKEVGKLFKFQRLTGI